MTSPLTMKQVAERLGSSEKYARKLILTGQLKAFQLGKRGYRVAPADLEAWITANTVTPLRDVVGEALAAMRGAA
jgi:excisionase family DNA binding protein